jgi:predicted GNAT family acetyltransferase
VIIAESTFTPPELRERGIAAKLTAELIDYAKRNNLKVCPACSSVVEYFRKRPDLSHLLSSRCDR